MPVLVLFVYITQVVTAHDRHELSNNRSNMCCWYGLYTFVALSLYYANINTCTKTGWKLWRATPKGFFSRSYRAVFPVHKIDISSCFRNQNVYCLLDYDVSMGVTEKYKRCICDLLQGPRTLWSITYHILVSSKGCLWSLWVSFMIYCSQSQKKRYKFWIYWKLRTLVFSICLYVFFLQTINSFQK